MEQTNKEFNLSDKISHGKEKSIGAIIFESGILDVKDVKEFIKILQSYTEFEGKYIRIDLERFDKLAGKDLI